MVGLDGRIKSSRFEKTIVCSVAQLSYEDAQGIICNTIDKGKLMREKQIT